MPNNANFASMTLSPPHSNAGTCTKIYVNDVIIMIRAPLGVSCNAVAQFSVKLNEVGMAGLQYTR
jgi:hypothetical protein